MNENLSSRRAELLRQNEALDQKLSELEIRQQYQEQVQIESHVPDATRMEDSAKQTSSLSDDASSTASKDTGDIPLNPERRKISTARKKSMQRTEGRTGSKKSGRSACDKTLIDTDKQPKYVNGNEDEKNNEEMLSDIDMQDVSEGLGMDATIRYQRARISVLQDEVSAATRRAKELQIENDTYKVKVQEVGNEIAGMTKKFQQTKQLLEKQKELTAALHAEQQILDNQLVAEKQKVDEYERIEKQASIHGRSKEVRLNRALEELDKLKGQLNEERQNNNERTVSRSDHEQLKKECHTLEKQKSELLLIFRKQMKLIDLLKRQKIHMEAAKALSFTEEEFSKILERGE